jgi:hypothetical protein
MSNSGRFSYVINSSLFAGCPATPSHSYRFVISWYAFQGGDKTLAAVQGALASPSTAYIYDWNMLPIGQQLWEKELLSYKEFPPLQAPETYTWTAH